MPDTEIPEDVRAVAESLVREYCYIHSGVEMTARIIMADRASRAPDPSRDGLVEAWQPIETAPKDGTPILGYFHADLGHAMLVVEYDPSREGDGFPWIAAESAAYHKNSVTHWRPLPTPPRGPSK